MADSETAKSTTTGRPSIIGPDSGPEAPFPLRMAGKVISGFGRGSKELGIPTANLPVDGATAAPWIGDAKSGVYFGWASLALPPSHPDHHRKLSDGGNDSPFAIYPMVMSIGYNPFYGNTTRSAEVHVLAEFAADFYGSPMRLLILGYIRPELDYSGLEALIRDIRIDCDVARASLARPAWIPREGEVVNGKRGELDGSWLVRPLEAEEMMDESKADGETVAEN